MAIKIYINESVNVNVAAGLNRRGVNAQSALDTGNLGLSDEEQLEFTAQQQAVIFTHDADFLRLARKWTSRGKTHWGIIYTHGYELNVGECIRGPKVSADVFDKDDFKNHIEFLLNYDEIRTSYRS